MQTDAHLERLTAPRTDAAVVRAKERWGERILDLALLRFADLVAAGMPQADAYRTVRPATTEKAAAASASRLLAHPDIQARLSQSAGKLPPRELARAAVPGVVQRMYEVAMGAVPDTPVAVQVKAGDSLLDRGGLPRSSELAVSALSVSYSAIDRLVTGRGEKPKRKRKRSDRNDRLDDARQRWQHLMPAAPESKT